MEYYTHRKTKKKKKANFGIRLQLRFEIMTVCHKSS